MREGVGVFLQCIFWGAFLLTTAIGVYLYLNDQKIFGEHKELPSESPGARSYNRAQVWAVWIHFFIFLGIFALSFSFRS